MKMKYFKATFYISIFLLAIGTYSCNDMLDVTPENVLTPGNSYQTLDDANHAILGVYSQLYTIANQYIILNELRGDLLDVTENYDKYLVELSKHSIISEDNPYADPKPFYSVINNCNDVIKNLNKMKSEHKINDLEYNERISDILTIRSWLYLQLGVHFGEIPYITKPFEQVSDLTNVSALPKLTLTALLDTLVNTMETLPVNTPYTTLSAVFDGITMGNGSWIDKRFFLAELYMWTDQYFEAAKIYRGLFDPPLGQDIYNYRRLASLSNYNPRNFVNIYTGTGRPYSDANIWCLFFDPKFTQNNTFVDLFAVNGGKYLLKPSKLSIDRWCLLPDQTDPGPNIDQRGAGIAWTSVNGKPMVNKLTMLYNSQVPYEKTGRWWIWKQESLHLHFAECANRDNHNYLAWILVNNGMSNYHSDTAIYKNYLNSTFKRTNEAFPYDLSGIQTSDQVTVDKYTIPAGNFLRNVGVRGRAQVANIMIPDTINGVAVDSTTFIEDMILDEAGLELAYEGHRWTDLVRIARRRNDPAILADRIYRKFLKNNNPNASAIREKLMTQANWFLPFPEK